MLLPEGDQDIWPKHVRVMYNKYKSIVQLVGGVIFCRFTIFVSTVA